MAFKTVESMRTKDGTFIDRVVRPEQNPESATLAWAKQRKWFFLYNCSLDENLAWATCEIKDDEGATHNYESYEAPTEPEEPNEGNEE